MKPGASFYCFMPQGGDQMMMMMMMMKSGIEPRHELIWLKNNHVLGRVDYAYIHEPILYAWKKGAGHKFYGGFQTSVLRYSRPNVSKVHPTQKPIKLIQKLIENSSVIGDIVFDPFLGSGTTLLACRKTGRIGLGCEINPDYEAIIRKRSMQNIAKLEMF
jgi:DNA modification methylase